MTVFPFQINEAVQLYNRVAKPEASGRSDREKIEPRDIVDISAEAKKRQVLAQMKNEVLEE